MALRKEDFGEQRERAGTMKDNQQFIPQERIPVEISRQLYYRIKAEATRRHIPTRQYLEDLLDETVPESTDVITPGHPPTQENLDKLKEISERLYRENNYQFFEDSVEVIREMREERLRELMGEDYSNE
jgi:hypothetical protein